MFFFDYRVKEEGVKVLSPVGSGGIGWRADQIVMAMEVTNGKMGEQATCLSWAAHEHCCGVFSPMGGCPPANARVAMSKPQLSVAA